LPPARQKRHATPREGRSTHPHAHDRRDSRSQCGSAGVTPSTLNLSRTVPRDSAARIRCHDRRDLCTLRGASEVALRGSNCVEPSRGKARLAFGTTTGAVPSSCGCSGVTSEAQDPHVASRGRLVSNPTTMNGTSSGRRCCSAGVAPRAVSLCRSPRRACGSVHTPARPIVFTDGRPCGVLVSHYLTN